MAPNSPEAELDVADDLYKLDPSDFVSARNELVRRLRKEARREVATRVAALRRPSPAAWAVNQLVRGHRDELDALVQLGEALRQAQTETLAGAGAAAELRQAGRARREAVARLADLAGASAHHGEVVSTLDAASLDPRAAALVASGRLPSALEAPSGFGDLDSDPEQADFDPQQAHFDPQQAASGSEAAPSPPADRQSPEPTGAHTAAMADAERAVAEACLVAANLLADAEEAAEVAARRRRAAADADARVVQLQRELDEAHGRATAEGRSADRATKAADVAAAAAAEAVQRRGAAERRLEQLHHG